MTDRVFIGPGVVDGRTRKQRAGPRRDLQCHIRRLLADTLNITPALAATVSGRFNA